MPGKDEEGLTMRYTTDDVRDAFFASRIDEMQRIGEGTLEQQWRSLVGPEAENVAPGDTLAGWRERYARGQAILADAMLVDSARQTAGADPLYVHQHQGQPIREDRLDSPVVQVPAGFIATTDAVRRVALKSRA
jgi:hypothetical protein